MAKQLPFILQGRYFTVKGEIDQDGSVNASCKFCPNKTVKGHVHATTNFHKHLKVNNSYLLPICIYVMCLFSLVSYLALFHQLMGHSITPGTDGPLVNVNFRSKCSKVCITAYSKILILFLCHYYIHGNSRPVTLNG